MDPSGMVATSQRSVSGQAAQLLARGWNAADVAVAAAAMLGVAEPCSTGIGGDLFALQFDASTGEVTALNASGRAPAGLSLERVGGALDPRSALTVTVPGACAGWADLLARHGTRSLAEALQPAIAMAEEGVEIGPVTAAAWRRSEDLLRSAPGGDALLETGRAPHAGERWRNPDLARTYRAVAAGGLDAFYRGPLAAAIASAVQSAGGPLTEQDLTAHRSTWDAPLCLDYRGATVWQCPPAGQGLAALQALGIAAGFELAALDPLGPERWHLLIESMRLAFADARRYIADPACVEVPARALLDPAYLASRRALIDPARAAVEVRHGRPLGSGGTVYLCAVDRAGNACSLVNSNYMGFGAGIVPPGCGFSLHNRGLNFSLDPDHPNVLAPGKRPYHTIIPGMLTRAGGTLMGPFGVMGGFMQPQGHLQLVVGLVDDWLDPQAALDRPRFCIDDEGGVCLEAGAPVALRVGLRERGHVLGGDAFYGRG